MEKDHKRMPVLVGDIGGTNSRLSIVTMSSIYTDKIETITTEFFKSNDYPDLLKCVSHFLTPYKDTPHYPVIGVLGIPGPVFNNAFSIIANLSWPPYSGEQMAKELGVKKFVFLNDFVVNGYGLLTDMKEGIDYEKLNNKSVDENGQIAMIGAGTGLGHGFLTKPEGGKYYDVYPSEGGHSSFTPTDERQWRYLKFLQTYYKVTHVSVERACSGPALPAMYAFFIEIEKIKSEGDPEKEKITPEIIIDLGLKNKSKVCEAVIEFFVELYAQAAGNLTVLVLPTRGLYLLGGLSVVLEEYIIKKSSFNSHFTNKGRLKSFLEKIPIFIVKNSLIGIRGAEEYARRILENEDKK